MAMDKLINRIPGSRLSVSSLPDLAIKLMYSNQLHAWWSTQSGLATLLSSLIACQWVRLQTLRRFKHKELSIDEMVRPNDLAVVRPTRVFLLDFLLWYSVLFTVEALSLLYLLFIY